MSNSSIDFLLNNSNQRDYIKTIIENKLINYSLSANHSNIESNWFQKTFKHITNLSGIEFILTDQTSSDIHYTLEIVSENEWDKTDDLSKRIIGTDNKKFNYQTTHKTDSYGGVRAQCEVTRVILKSLGLSFPNGDSLDENYTFNDSIMSGNLVGQLKAGRVISTTVNDQLAIQSILGTNKARLETEKYHNTKLNEDLLIGENGRKDYFILNRKGCYTGADAAHTFEESSDGQGTIFKNFDYLNASVANFNPEEGDKIFLSRKLFSPYGDGYPTNEEIALTSAWVNNDGKDVVIDLIQASEDLGPFETEDELHMNSSSNLIFNEAGKLILNVNGTEQYVGPWGGAVPSYVNGHLAAFIDIQDTHYKKLPLNCFEIVDYDWKAISNSYDNNFYKLADNRFGFGPTKDTVDEITGLSTIQFNDKSLHVTNDIKGTFDQVTGLNTDSGEMFRLYNAAFARFPDADGLKYWIDQFSSGRNTRRVVAQSFLGSAEFTEKYGSNVSDETYVNNLYKNVLGRDADAEGLNYWVGNLSSGLETRYEALLGFAESAENKTLFSEMTGLV
ncbi:hypothetical protein PMN2A_1391 [Prochlorococcus marinus str. NATL2A]|uniref:DUF4214 domain-containing protein n=1 Tax=Prochlorococcus marinus (strain NATL2A) TaxID=59920 RepID=Q46HZ9_PROMT|nr:DUF4214 domain-containing protein [Prochlorococcus marinus]AAZ58879.1 hypothetical protein PMN2A_1391 [Prochlorococcus marinus str. NATL2A]